MTTIVSIEVTTDDAEQSPRFFAHLAAIDEEALDVEIPEALVGPLVQAVGNLGQTITTALSQQPSSR